MSKVLLISNDIVGPTMAGPGIRYTEMARELAKEHTLLLAAPEGSHPFKGENWQLITYAHGHFQSLKPRLIKSDVVIAQSLHPTLLRTVRNHRIRYIADLYDPIVLENLEAQRVLPLKEQQAQHDFFLTVSNTQLALADHILCASDRQRDYWLGALTALGRLQPAGYRNDPSTESLISLLPFGCPSYEPKLTRRDAVLDFIPQFEAKKDHLLIWGGGIWNWFDPLTLIKAVAKLSQKRSDLYLLFLGTKHPNPHTPEMKMLNAAHELAEKLGVKDRTVFFNERWVPYEELSNYLLPASVGVSTHFNHAETRLSFRTRILSYLWTGLPILATRGDSMADLIEREGLGLTVDYEDVNGMVNAITSLTKDAKLRSEIKANIERIKPQFTWPHLIAPLSKRIKEDNFPTEELFQLDYLKLISRYYLTGSKKVWQSHGTKGLLKKINHR